MEEFLLNLGLSWTLSKLLPYILFLLIGVAFSFYLKKLHKAIRIALFPLPFLIYFAFSPIYQGDFSNSPNHFDVENLTFLKQDELSVIAIPGCPYCYALIDDLKLIRKRTESKKITFWVITTEQDHLDWYNEKVNGAFEVKSISPTIEGIAKISGGNFPTIIYRSVDELTVWSNDSFGVKAKDWVETELKKGSN